MLDLENREYEEVAGQMPGGGIVFLMKNGLGYLVRTSNKDIQIAVAPESFFKMVYSGFEPPESIDKDRLEKAKEILKTAKIPVMSKEQIAALEKGVAWWIKRRNIRKQK